MNAGASHARVVRQAPPKKWRRILVVFPVVAAAVSCATNPNGGADQRQVPQPALSLDAGAEQVAPTGQLGPDPALSGLAPKEQAEPAAPKRSATQSEQKSAESADAGKDHKRLKRRSDGRPVWWIESPQREHGEVRVAAEALGVDLRGARRAAIDAGLRLLAHELGAQPEDWIVQAAAIKPLRAVRGPDSVNRFVGYVLMSAKSPT